MKVFELHYPGMGLVGVQDQHNVQNLLIQLETQLADASIGLALFEESNTRLGVPDHAQQQARSHRIAQEMEANLPHDLDARQRYKERRAIYEFADLQARREEWAAGRLPEGYKLRPRFIYAHTVVYALDAIGKILNIMTEMGLPPGVTDARDGYNSALPNLVKVRDSAHHIEDRARGVHHHHHPLVLQPIDNGAISAPEGGFLGLSILNGNKLGYTASDGYYREIEISVTSVAAAQSAIQQVLDALTWQGQGNTVPR